MDGWFNAKFYTPHLPRSSPTGGASTNCRGANASAPTHLGGSPLPFYAKLTATPPHSSPAR